MNVLIVDDEPLARNVLRKLLEDSPDVAEIHDVGTGEEAVAELETGTWEVVFLDVQMPGLDGFGVLDRLTDPAPVVVFVTAHEQHAVAAFGVHAADYLLKPVARERFQTALDRARTRLHARDVERRGDDLIAAIRGLRGQSHARELRLEDAQGIHVVHVDALLRVESDDKHVVLTGEHRTWRIRRPLASIVSLLDPNEFLQVHRSCLVSRSRITGLAQTDGGAPYLTLDDGARVRVSKARLASVRSHLLR